MQDSNDAQWMFVDLNHLHKKALEMKCGFARPNKEPVGIHKLKIRTVILWP